MTVTAWSLLILFVTAFALGGVGGAFLATAVTVAESARWAYRPDRPVGYQGPLARAR